jgi:hypothetical protein
MSLWSSLNGPVFIIALGIGLLVTYVTVPAPKLVIKFPTPFNAGKVVYAGHPMTSAEEKQEGGKPPEFPADAGDCYKYKATEVDCKDYPGKVKPQPMTLGAAAIMEDAVGPEGFLWV